MVNRAAAEYGLVNLIGAGAISPRDPADGVRFYPIIRLAWG